MNLIETIKFENGKFANIKLHQIRMNNARNLLFDCNNNIYLNNELEKYTKNHPIENIQKCRIIYNKQIENIEFHPYVFPKIKSLKIVFNDLIDYNFKYENRESINQLFKQRQNCDDILIIKDGLITDTSYCNILFFDGKRWLTPEKPLLKGVQRQFLIENEIIETANITISDLQYFTKARLINAMIGFEQELNLKIEKIY